MMMMVAVAAVVRRRSLLLPLLPLHACLPPIAPAAVTGMRSIHIGALGIHDVGGKMDPTQAALQKDDRPMLPWEYRTHALVVLAVKKKMFNVDAFRRAIEALPQSSYYNLSYYEKWAAGVASLCCEKGFLSEQDISEAYGETRVLPSSHALKAGDTVRVHDESFSKVFRKPHLRTPGYVFGCVGTVDEVVGLFPDPALNAFSEESPPQTLYRVSFAADQIWPYGSNAADDGTNQAAAVTVDIFGSWLSRVEASNAPTEKYNRGSDPSVRGNFDYDNAEKLRSDPELAHKVDEHQHRHTHAHEHEHEHTTRDETEVAANEKEREHVFALQPLAEVLPALLAKQGLFSMAELSSTVAAVENMGKNMAGAKLVARAWVDAEFKRLLLSNADAAAAQLGFETSNYEADAPSAEAQHPEHQHVYPDGQTLLSVVENTPTTHNLVVCTLCSCYPVAVLGMSPSWYKSLSYRMQAIRQPHRMLRDEFGLSLPDGAKINVHDSTANLRYMVLPQRPAGTDGWTEEELLPLITRDSLIGTGLPLTPSDHNQ